MAARSVASKAAARMPSNGFTEGWPSGVSDKEASRRKSVGGIVQTFP